MSESQEKFYIRRSIRVYLDDTNPDNPRVKTVFSKQPFTPEQFTQVFMGILEAYTASLLENNSAEQIFEHFNNVFGIFLNKLLPADKIYEKSASHKEFKDIVDKTLGQEDSEELKKEADANKLAAYLLCRDILIKEIGLTEESADLILNRRLGLLNPPKEVEDGKKE
jgi:hypothetical protein